MLLHSSILEQKGENVMYSELLQSIRQREIYTGDTFYYANRKTKQAEECVAIELVPQFPEAYIAKNEETGEIFKCYPGFDSFKSKQEAYADAQIEGDRIIY